MGQQDFNVRPTVNSTRYPDYKIIYNFPYVLHASLLNIMKRNFLLFMGASIPITVILQMLGYITVKTGISFIASGFVVLGPLQLICLFCNNSIGAIYLKDNKNVIISYLNYWGKRVDLSTDVDDIIVGSTVPSTVPLYKMIHMKSCKAKLKLHTKYGKIIEESNYHDIFDNFK
ncbi:PREDICTED: uncharacterized protein LOC108574614 [Habropoda laboriosa]|nr:PREDICTED: uncharacterized protein LOC108574614 [Habropoda laboriosa]